VSLRPIKVKEEMVTTNVVWEFKKLKGFSSFFKNTPPASKFKDTTRDENRSGGKKSRKSRKTNNRRKTKKHKNHKNHKNHNKSRRKSV